MPCGLCCVPLNIGLRTLAPLAFIGNQFDLERASHRLGVSLERRHQGRVLAGGFQTRDRTFSGAHTGGDGFLGEADAGAGGEHFVGDGVFDLQRIIGFGKAGTLGRFFDEGLVMWRTG